MAPSVLNENALRGSYLFPCEEFALDFVNTLHPPPSHQLRRCVGALCRVTRSASVLAVLLLFDFFFNVLMFCPLFSVKGSNDSGGIRRARLATKPRRYVSACWLSCRFVSRYPPVSTACFPETAASYCCSTMVSENYYVMFEGARERGGSTVHIAALAYGVAVEMPRRLC